MLVSSLFFCSQLLAAQISDLANLWKASTLVGFSYGTIFGLFPTVCIEFFGPCASPFPSIHYIQLLLIVHCLQRTFLKIGAFSRYLHWLAGTSSQSRLGGTSMRMSRVRPLPPSRRRRSQRVNVWRGAAAMSQR